MAAGFKPNASRKSFHRITWQKKWVLQQLWFTLGKTELVNQMSVSGRF